jgi:oxygen-independent coproporphyrinogen-3 oxidase
VRKCPYCDFNSHAIRGAIPEQGYVDALLDDLAAERVRVGPDRPLISIFIGGGTPSLFSGGAVQRLLDGVRERFPLQSDAEITLEANPGTVDTAHFGAYAQAGVNRLSIGVQSLDDALLERLGRIHTAADGRRAVASARRAGITNINLDLMFALPGQTLAAAGADLEQLLVLEPTHVSYYELTLEPNTPFYLHPPERPDHDLADAIQQQGLGLLHAAGFVRYEISAFAQAGRRCRHNLNYWRFGDYLGIGAGAHGKLTDPHSGEVRRRAKSRHPEAYLRAADPTSSVRSLSAQDLIEEFALNAFRLVDGFSSSEFERATGLSADFLEGGLAAAERLDLLTCSAGADGQTRIRPSRQGLAFLNDLVACFSA